MRQFFNQRHQIVGTLHDDGIFRKRVTGKIHLYKNEQGWGMDKKVLDSLPDGTEIRIQDKDDGTVYITSKEVFNTGSQIDFGHGTQVVLWKGFFDTKKDGVLTKSSRVSHWMEMHAFFDSYTPN